MQAKTIFFLKKDKPHKLLDLVKFETIVEGECIQMLYVGIMIANLNLSV